MTATLHWRPVADADLATVAALAHTIWWQHYPPLIGEQQTRYMLARMYAPERLRQELADGVCYRLAWLDDEPVGYLSVRPGPCAALDKLYLLPSRHRQGLGQQMLEYACRLAAEQGGQRLQLRVNRDNRQAIAAYERAGFRCVGEDCAAIGDGFVMDDFIYERSLL